MTGASAPDRPESSPTSFPTTLTTRGSPLRPGSAEPCTTQCFRLVPGIVRSLATRSSSQLRTDTCWRMGSSRPSASV
eukprot:5018909-Alexandrium_andersonii.AAC.1